MAPTMNRSILYNNAAVCLTERGHHTVAFVVFSSADSSQPVNNKSNNNISSGPRPFLTICTPVKHWILIVAIKGPTPTVPSCTHLRAKYDPKTSQPRCSLLWASAAYYQAALVCPTTKWGLRVSLWNNLACHDYADYHDKGMQFYLLKIKNAIETQQAFCVFAWEFHHQLSDQMSIFTNLGTFPDCLRVRGPWKPSARLKNSEPSSFRSKAHLRS